MYKTMTVRAAGGASKAGTFLLKKKQAVALEGTLHPHASLLTARNVFCRIVSDTGLELRKWEGQVRRGFGKLAVAEKINEQVQLDPGEYTLTVETQGGYTTGEVSVTYDDAADLVGVGRSVSAGVQLTSAGIDTKTPKPFPWPALAGIVGGLGAMAMMIKRRR